MPKSDQGIDVSLKRQRYTVIPRTLVFITRGDHVLLLRGSPQKRIWANKYNGIGGHIERDEDIYSAAQREVREETGLEVEDLRLVGLINIDGDQPTGIMLFVFTANPDRVIRSRRKKARWNGSPAINWRRSIWWKTCRSSCRARSICRPTPRPSLRTITTMNRNS